MKIFLTEFPVRNVRASPETEDLRMSYFVTTKLDRYVKRDDPGPGTMRRKIESLRSELASRFQPEDGEWPLDIQLDYLLDTSQRKVEAINLTVKGRLFKELYELLLFVNSEERLCVHGAIYDKQSSFYEQLELLPQEDKDAPEKVNHESYQLRKQPLPDLPTSREGHSNRGKIILWVEVEDFIQLGDLFPPLPVRNRRILKEKRFCDFELVAEDGTRVPCHKVFLAESPVLATMVDPQAKFEESTKNEAKMDGMSGEGVNALLEYLYCGIIIRALKCDKICLELFQAGHKYHLPGLEKAMKAVLLDKESNWFEVDTVLEMHQFVRNYEGEKSQQLNDKVSAILMDKSDPEYEQSELFAEIFNNDLAKELFKMTLNKNKKTQK